MNFINLDLKKIIIILGLLLLPLISVNLKTKPDEPSLFSDPFLFTSGIVQRVYFGLVDEVRSTTRQYINLIGVKKEISQLQKEHRFSKARLLQYAELLSENNRLRTLLDFNQNSPHKLIAARLIGRDLFIDRATILINRGTHHGVQPNMAVITTKGVVGYVFRPSTFSSQILLLTDRSSFFDGMVERTRTLGFVEGGKHQKKCIFKLHDRAENVAINDVIVTSGLDPMFPKGIPIGTVKKIFKKSYSASTQVLLDPIVDPYNLEEVFIIKTVNETTPDPNSEASL